MRTWRNKAQQEDLRKHEKLKFEIQVEEEKWLHKPPLEKYWTSCKRDLFVIKDYALDFTDDLYHQQYDELAYLVRLGKTEDVKSILKMDRRFNPKITLKESGETILHVAAEFGHIEIFQWIVDTYPGTNINYLTEAKETPFIFACREGKVEFVKFLLAEYKADLNIETRMSDGWTPLFYASFNGFLQLTKVLLEAGADPNRLDRLQNCPLHYAARFNNVKMARLLLEYGGRWNMSNKEEMLPVCVARAHNNDDVAKLLNDKDMQKKKKMLKTAQKETAKREEEQKESEARQQKIKLEKALLNI